MTYENLSGKTLALIAASGAEESQVTGLQRGLITAKARVRLVSPESGVMNTWHAGEWGHFFAVEQRLNQALAADYDALIIPGGDAHVRKLADSIHTKRLLDAALAADQPTLLIEQAVGLLTSIDGVVGRSVTAPEAASESLTKAQLIGASEDLTRDKGLITARETVAIERMLEALDAALAGRDLADAA